MQRLSALPEGMVASQEELCSMELEFIVFLSSVEKLEKKSTELGSLERACLNHWALRIAALALVQHCAVPHWH
jgi:hypothetical protein